MTLQIFAGTGEAPTTARLAFLAVMEVCDGFQMR